MVIFHDAAEIQNCFVVTAFCGKTVFYIIVGTISAGTDLIPDTFFDLWQILGMYQIAELPPGEL